MSASAEPRQFERARPLVAVVSAVPLLGEAVRSALEFADVQLFAAGAGDLDGLLRWLRPDAVVVDSDAGAEQAAAFAREGGMPVLHVSMHQRELRLYRDGNWTHIANGEEPTAEAIRNVVAGAVFAGGAR